jgi:hypothetical protein
MAEATAVVLRDGEGNYYLFDDYTVDAHRVPEEQVAQLEEALELELAGHAMREGFDFVGLVDIELTPEFIDSRIVNRHIVLKQRKF